MERLQKVIAQAGVASRRKAEEMISEGRVKVNGKVVDTQGFKVSGDDIITVDGKPLKKEEHVYFLVNKPKKYVCTANDEHDRAKVVDLVDCDKRIFPVGRLDYDSTGLIILTNDGEFSNMLTHPKFHLAKKYRVTVKGVVNKAQLNQLREGIILDDGYKTNKCEAEIISYDNVRNHCVLDMTIYEGKNRQIRRMIEALGYTVSKLHRYQFGTIRDDQMPSGSYRRLKPFEIKTLKELTQKGAVSK